MPKGLGRVRFGGGMAAIEIHGWSTGKSVGMSGTRWSRYIILVGQLQITADWCCGFSGGRTSITNLKLA